MTFLGCVKTPLPIVRFIIKQKTVNGRRSWGFVGPTSKRFGVACQLLFLGAQRLRTHLQLGIVVLDCSLQLFPREGLRLLFLHTSCIRVGARQWNLRIVSLHFVVEEDLDFFRYPGDGMAGQFGGLGIAGPHSGIPVVCEGNKCKLIRPTGQQTARVAFCSIVGVANQREKSLS